MVNRFFDTVFGLGFLCSPLIMLWFGAENSKFLFMEDWINKANTMTLYLSYSSNYISLQKVIITNSYNLKVSYNCVLVGKVKVVQKQYKVVQYKAVQSKWETSPSRWWSSWNRSCALPDAWPSLCIAELEFELKPGIPTNHAYY